MFSCRAPLTSVHRCSAAPTQRSGVSTGSMEFSPLICLFKNLYREKTRAALTDVKNIGKQDRYI
jgi:hypothetical protein